MLRFTTRDLLWLMVVIALTVGWWLDHRTADTRLVAAVNRVAGQWALEVGHPVSYTIPLQGGGTFNGVMGP